MLWISQHWHSHQIRHRYHRWCPLEITHGNFGNGKKQWFLDDLPYFNPISKWWFTNTWLDIHIIHFLDTWSVAQVTEHAVAVTEHRSDRAVLGYLFIVFTIASSVLMWEQLPEKCWPSMAAACCSKLGEPPNVSRLVLRNHEFEMLATEHFPTCPAAVVVSRGHHDTVPRTSNYGPE